MEKTQQHDFLPANCFLWTRQSVLVLQGRVLSRSSEDRKVQRGLTLLRSFRKLSLLIKVMVLQLKETLLLRGDKKYLYCRNWKSLQIFSFFFPQPWKQLDQRNRERTTCRILAWNISADSSLITEEELNSLFGKLITEQLLLCLPNGS